MFFVRGFATDLVLKYLAAFILLAGLLSTDAVPILRRSPRPNSYRHADNANTLSFHNAPRALPAHEPNQVRSDIATLGERGLVKRGNCFSSGNTWTCSNQPPTVAECVTQIRNHGQVGTRISVFYTGLGGRTGLTTCLQYFACNTQIGTVVSWDNIVDDGWYLAQATAIGPQNAGPIDVFQKRLSQAFGEATRGDAYVCTPESNAPNNDFNQDLAWGGWEYPALTRNPDVTNIIRVDPATSRTATIWRQGDAATPNAPRG